MKKSFTNILFGLAFAPIAFAPLALAGDHGGGNDREYHGDRDPGGDRGKARGLVEAVRDATSMYRDVTRAEADGWGSLGRCVSSGGDEGAMGTHYVNLGNLLDGNVLDAAHPEVLMFEEERHGRKRLIGAEFIVFADEWDAAHPAPENTPPSLMGQLFHYIGAPNRYRLPPVYILHVWAWKDNPNGAYSNWNPRVSCENFEG